MKLIVESGATKADWCLCETDACGGGRVVRQIRTPGINVSVMTEDAVDRIVSGFVASADEELVGSVDELHFYAAGIVSSDVSAHLERQLGKHFRPACRMEFASDLLAAARALFGDGGGVAAIMGTGSNSCLYDGKEIVRCISSGGFVLGDEGSGASLGRMFLSDYFKGLVPPALAKEFAAAFPDVDYASAVREIYRGEAPSRYLASFAPFVTGHRDDSYAAGLVAVNVRNFVERSLSRYGCRRIGVAGSLGLACRSELERAVVVYGLEFVNFVQAPMSALIDYHYGV